jgi:uncharacterized protein (TIGR02284 family)
MAPTDWIGTVKKLIEICTDGEHGYGEAAHHASRPELKEYFETQSAHRALFAEELRRELSSLTAMRVHGSAAAALHRGWLDLLSRIAGGERGVLTAVAEGERLAIAEYESAIQNPLPPQIERLARTQLDEIRRAYNSITPGQPPIAA